MEFADSPSLSTANADRFINGWKGQWIGLVGLFALLSFTWLPNSYLLMVGWPYCLWWQGAFCLFLGWSLWISRQFSQSLRLLGHRLDWVMLCLLSAGILSSLFAQFPFVAGWNILLFSSFCIFLYVAVAWLRSTPWLKYRLWFSLVLTGTITNIISLAAWRPTVDMWSSQSFYAAIRNPQPLGHHNFVGGYCLLMLPLVVGFTLTQQGKWRWLGFGAIALNAITLYISGSRGALLGAVALCLVLIPLYIFCYPSKTRKHWIAVTLLCFLLLGICTSNPRVRALFTIAPSASTQLFSIDQLSDGPTKDRLFMLHSGLRILKQHPLLGVGPGNLSRVYNQYRPVDVGDGLELVQQLHNMPAQIMAETGLIGFGGYLLWLASLVKLAWAIQKRVNNRRDRILLYSISASWFAYTVSSLTDYQLENIGIATVLSLTTALLICLADQHLDSSTTHSLSSRARRLLSLGLLLYFSIALNMWTRADIGFYLSNAANKDIENVNLVDADAKLLKASELLPWDPTPAALASEHLIYLSEQTTDAKKRETLTSAAIDSLRAAVQAAPNDPWFNQNLAVLLLHEHPAQALPYSLHAVSLFPRGAHSSYYTLGKIYLKQHNPENAVTAFVLESLANPKFLVSPIWQSPSLSPYLSGVLEQTLTTWEDVLHATSPGSQQHRWLNQQIILIKWWYHQPFSSQTIDDSYTQLILGLDADRERSLAQLKQLAASVPPQQDSDKLTLLRAWLAPEDYFSDAVEGTSITPEEKQTVIDDIHTYTDIRTWLTSIQQPMSTSLRYGLAFAYRNHSASRIRQILHADGLSSSYLLDQLSLFSSPPREFSQLDRKIFQIFQTKLSSAHV